MRNKLPLSAGEPLTMVQSSHLVLRLRIPTSLATVTMTIFLKICIMMMTMNQQLLLYKNVVSVHAIVEGNDLVNVEAVFVIVMCTKRDAYTDYLYLH